jgi:hypothetical protein
MYRSLVKFSSSDDNEHWTGAARGSAEAWISISKRCRGVRAEGHPGFGVLESLNQEQSPAAIMVAAHGKHAVEAFRGGTVDGLSKAVGATRRAATPCLKYNA